MHASATSAVYPPSLPTTPKIFPCISFAYLRELTMFMLMFFGGSAGSTGGGIKILRVMLFVKNSAVELKRLIHPNAVIPVRFNGNAVPPEIINNVFAFISFYILTMIISVMIMAGLGYDLDTSLGAVAATLGNIGPGIGEVGPVSNYAHMPGFGKWFLSFLMLIGRLELFTVLILFSRGFWTK
jgi:trk system potassium uptake protein TrkH